MNTNLIVMKLNGQISIIKQEIKSIFKMATLKRTAENAALLQCLED